MFKIAFKYIGFRYRQHRRKTSEKLVVDTVYGPVRGVKRISCWDDPYYSFERIPFAKPPVGELRFAEPQPPEPWTKPRKCYRSPPLPLQGIFYLKIAAGSENCLFLNVFTPKTDPKELKPVMVWLYGGGFEMGGATRDMYGPDYFMQKDVVLVTINYRVGVLGFLSLKDPKLKVPGNAGLKDQVLALRWVQANIARFGGDPNNVTLFGESAGGASTHYLMLTHKTKGLFHKAILMSGNAFCPWATAGNRYMAYRLAKKVGYTGENNEEKILNYLRSTSGRQVAEASVKIITKDERKNNVVFMHVPVVEPYETEQCVVPKDPLLMARDTWSNHIPVIMGGCSNEGYIFNLITKKLNIPKIVGDCETLIPDIAKAPNNMEIKTDHIILKQLYFGSKPPTLPDLFELLADRNFWHPIRRALFSRLSYSDAPTYLYRFAVDSNFNMIRRMLCGDEMKGTCHGDDLLYLFFGMMTTSISTSSKEYKTIQQFVGMFAEFARTGNPNSAAIQPAVWEAAGKNDVPTTCLNIGERVEMMELPYNKRLDVWDSFYPKDTLI